MIVEVAGAATFARSAILLCSLVVLDDGAGFVGLVFWVGGAGLG
jgi:hypothetical protein